ncbi:MAG: DUF2264 domain-containing protein, partial [Oxalobacteraceae bacterium]
MERRNFLGSLVAGSAATLATAGEAGAASKPAARPASDRAYMAGLLQKMTEPVLSAMARGELVRKFELEVSPTWDGRDKRVSYFECFARLIAGAAPWLALS